MSTEETLLLGTEPNITKIGLKEILKIKLDLKCGVKKRAFKQFFKIIVLCKI